MRQQVTGHLSRIEVRFDQPEDQALTEAQDSSGVGFGDYGGTGVQFAAVDADTAVLDRNPDDPESWGKVGRNEPCPCGSGKKFKHCHGQFA